MPTRPARSTRGGPAVAGEASKALGERVRAARQAAGLSQAQLAGTALTKGFISQIESGIVRPSVRSLQHIATTLGRPIAYFVGDEAEAATKRVAFHRLAAEAAAERADWPAAQREARAGLALATDPAERATFHRLLANAALRQGQRELAFDHVASGLQLLDVAAHPVDVARLTYVRGLVYGEAGQLAAANEAFEQVRDIIERHEILDPRLRARVAVALGTTYRRLGRTTKAVAAYESALATASRANELALAAQGFMGIAVSHFDAGDLDAAIASYERALGLFERVSDTGFELHVRQSLAAIHVQQGNVARARELADRTLVRAGEVGDTHWAAVAQAVRARVLLVEGDALEAKRVARQAERALAAAADPIQRAAALRVVGAAAEARGETPEADHAFRQALDLLAAVEDRADRSATAIEYAQLLRARGATDAAFAMLELAHERR